MTPTTVEDLLLIKTAKTEKAGLFKNDCGVFCEIVELAYAV